MKRRLIRRGVAPAVILLSVNLCAEVHDAKTGALLDRQETHNLVVTAGLNLIRDLLKGDSTATITHFAVGTSSTAVSASDTTLGTEVFRDAVTQKTAASSRLTVKYYLGSTSANGSTLTEAGLFTAASLGTMFARAVLATSVVKTSSVTVTFTWDINLAAA